MERISCCGVDCGACRFFPAECAGCPEIEGRVFWLHYTGEERCGIYRCCVLEKRLRHCGQCSEMPCARLDAEDPTLSPEENQAIRRGRIRILRAMAVNEKEG